MSGRVTWLVVFGMVLALAGGSFAMLPAASAQDLSQFVRVTNGVIVCERGVDRRAFIESGRRDTTGGDCVLADNFLDDFVFSPPSDLDFGRTSARFGWFYPGRLAMTEVVSEPWSAPRVFCTRSARSGAVLVEDVEHFPISARSSGSSTVTYTISLQNDEANQGVQCWWVHLADGLPESTPTPEPPRLEVTPRVQDPDIFVTPVVPPQLPTSTPMMPELQITPPAPINTPVVQLPTPTPTPELGEPPVIVVTPVIPIEIVTPIVIPVVPTEPPELIHRDPGGEAIA